MIVDGDASNLRRKLSSHLENQGIRLRGESSTISSSAAVSRILSIIGISRGEEAWSLNRLTDLVEQIGLPMTWGVLDIEHPEQPDWSPKLHPETLVEIARGFHVLGGRGSLRRWLSTLSQATPRFTGDEDQSRALEESQWWLAAMSRWMIPILSKQDREIAVQKCIGCISGEELPLPEPPENPIIWFNSLLEQIIVLAAFIPVIIGVGGNVGTQSSTIVVRGLATGRVDAANTFPLILKELLVGSILGVAYGLVVGFAAEYITGIDMSNLGLVIGLSIFCSMTIATAVGASVPIVLKKLGFDPAISTGPFVTTAIDIIGVALYFVIASTILIN